MKEYVKLTLPELKALDPARTILAMVLSPIEVHGPHLPLCTDIVISRGVMEATLARVQEVYPEFELLILPEFHLGSDPLPVSGSLGIPAKSLEAIMFGFGQGLAQQGFKYMMVFDNHGGPRHQTALASAVRRLWRRYGFHMMIPFLRIYRDMVLESKDLMDATDLAPSTMGDDTDSHAGTNETSLYMDIAGLDPVRNVPPSPQPDPKGMNLVLLGFSGFLSSLGAKGLSQDIAHIARTLTWVKECAEFPYCGDPTRATPEAGGRMKDYHAKVGVGMLEDALKGGTPEHEPIGWNLRIARFF